MGEISKLGCLIGWSSRHMWADCLYFLCVLYFVSFAAHDGTTLDDRSVYWPVSNCVKETMGKYLLASGVWVTVQNKRDNNRKRKGDRNKKKRKRENVRDITRLPELKLETLCPCVATFLYEQSIAQHFREECQSVRRQQSCTSCIGNICLPNPNFK
jgi:hypothetical protein